ncbi:hypothetical protein CU254_41845 (plasmid) [Amycolatopsis sp. AA4]|uniref:hypothetical protein n=1 Tax=Actinomycetes TaxID=1760 RepID=UPI0001B5713F|nr:MULTISPECIES: hypothetical protein [Actinomycetes]ATY17123.1 hypothetical protein CU254_41845 [Amycolatopsis sp. AA4]EFL12645.1 predicted protein [Streptomyces sp. AA4]
MTTADEDATAPTRLADYVPLFDVTSPLPLDHDPFAFGECGERCRCAPDSAEGEFLMSSSQRRDEIRALLTAEGKTAEMCGPCNALVFAASDEDRARFQAEHEDCPWHSVK